MAILNSHIIDKLDSTHAAGLSRKDFDYKTYLDFLNANLIGLDRLVLGRSIEGRKIFALNFGQGPIKILLWSQMHGNEPSSSLALLQVLELLASDRSEFARQLAHKLTIRAIPVLNPDGAEHRIRRNAQNIDLNRDALSLVAPESRILKAQLDNFAPDWAFNLHDQELYYGTDNSDLPTAMALLAPSVAPGSQLQARRQAMALIGALAKTLSVEINIAKYSDTYIPTAFGDFFSSQGVRTVLLETGYIIGDADRKKSTFYIARAILMSLALIAQSGFNDKDLIFYENLPFNRKHKFFDIILRKVKVKGVGEEFFTDLALCRDRRDREHFTDYDRDFYVYDVGDLRFGKAFEIIDCKGKLVLDVKKIVLYSQANEILLKCKNKLSIFS